MRVLLLSHSDANSVFRVGSHHIARELSLAGHDVMRLATPYSVAHRVLGRGRTPERMQALRNGLSRDADGVLNFTPSTVLPAGVAPPRLRVLLRSWLRGGLADVAFIDQQLLWSRSLLDVARVVIFRPTDTVPPGGVKQRLERQILQHVDGVAATSSAVLAGLDVGSLPTMVIPNGVDLRHFTTAGSGSRDDSCVYVGALDARFSWRDLEAMASATPATSFDVFGPVNPALTPQVPANVTLHGPIQYDDLPKRFARARVGLLPLSDESLNAGRSPMKLYEYLASGLAVVTRETPTLASDEPAGIYSYQDAEGAAEAVRRALSHATPNVAGAALAQGHGWAAKTAELLDFACAVGGRRRAVRF